MSISIASNFSRIQRLRYKSSSIATSTTFTIAKMARPLGFSCKLISNRLRIYLHIEKDLERPINHLLYCICMISFCVISSANHPMNRLRQKQHLIEHEKIPVLILSPSGIAFVVYLIFWTSN